MYTILPAVTLLATCSQIYKESIHILNTKLDCIRAEPFYLNLEYRITITRLFQVIHRTYLPGRPSEGRNKISSNVTVLPTSPSYPGPRHSIEIAISPDWGPSHVHK